MVALVDSAVERGRSVEPRCRVCRMGDAFALAGPRRTRFASFGLAVGRIGILNSVYPAVWGVFQIVTGPLSDRWGRKRLIATGMWCRRAGSC